MQVVARHFDAGHLVGEAETDHAPRDRGQGPFALVSRHLGQRHVGRALGRHAAQVQVRELAVEADRHHLVGRRHEVVDDLAEIRQPRQLRDLEDPLGGEGADHREGGPGRRGDLADAPLVVHHEGGSVDDDELTPEVLDGAEAEVAMFEDLAQRHVAVEAPGHQGVEGPGLEGGVLGPGVVVESGAVQKAQVQGPQQPVVHDVARRHLATSVARRGVRLTRPPPHPGSDPAPRGCRHARSRRRRCRRGWGRRSR